jgi:hypothetical protein
LLSVSAHKKIRLTDNDLLLHLKKQLSIPLRFHSKILLLIINKFCMISDFLIQKYMGNFDYAKRLHSQVLALLRQWRNTLTFSRSRTSTRSGRVGFLLTIAWLKPKRSGVPTAGFNNLTA